MLDGKTKKTKSGIEYQVGKNYNGQIEVAYTRADGRRVSMASFKQLVKTEKKVDGKVVEVVKQETQQQVVARLKRELGIA